MRPICVSGFRNNNNNNGIGAYRPSLCVGSNVIVSVNEMKDLGVIADNTLILNYILIVDWAFVRTNLIDKCFISRDIHTLLHAFKTHVRPILEYASCSWSPHVQGSIKHTESVQRKFTKRF